MIIIGNCILSDELMEEQFICDLPACLGACCVEGDSGAPLEEEETRVLESVLGRVSAFMIPEGIEAVNRQSCWVRDSDGDLTTPLVEGKQCAYVFFDGKGVAKCSIEKAFEEGLIDFRKPLSCHLYPIRIKKYPHYDALNYHRWPICEPARAFGSSRGVPVYRFLKDALIRKYGSGWYEELEEYLRYSLGEK